MDTALVPESVPSGNDDERILRDNLDLSMPYVAPRTALEEHVAEIWRRAFGLDRIGVHDDYFDLRGDSIFGSAIMAEVERVFGLLPDLSLLFRCPTVESFAAALSDKAVAANSSAIIPLKSGGSKSPFFVVHGRLGHIFLPPAFTDNLDVERPVYGFQFRAQGLEEHEAMSASVEGMAERYIVAMRKIQPSGPYVLGSVCAGCYVALEMARTLRGQGELIEHLVFVDPPIVPLSEERRHPSLLSRKRIGRILRLISVMGGDYGSGGRRVFWRAVWRRMGQHFKKRAGDDTGDDNAFFVQGEQRWLAMNRQGRAALEIDSPAVFEAARRASKTAAATLRNYEPTPYEGKAKFIFSEDRAIRAADPEIFWRSLVGEMRIYVASPTHDSMFAENAADAAIVINEAIHDVS